MQDPEYVKMGLNCEELYKFHQEHGQYPGQECIFIPQPLFVENLNSEGE